MVYGRPSGFEKVKPKKLHEILKESLSPVSRSKNGSHLDHFVLEKLSMKAIVKLIFILHLSEPRLILKKAEDLI